jgi:hypothetical protein
MNSRMLEMADFTKVNGIKRLEKEMAWGYNSGQMVQSMRECGRKIKQMEREE